MRKAETRVAEMAAMRAHGVTLAEVGERYGVSRERVRQLLVKGGYDAASLKRVAARRRDRKHADALQQELLKHRSEIRGLLLSGRSIPSVASSLGTTLAAVRAVDRELGGVARRTSRSSFAPKYRDDEVLDCLRGANVEIGGILTGNDYDALANERSFDDGRPWPGRQTAILRFGSWREALVAARLLQNKSSGIRGKLLFDREQCIDALLEVARAVGRLPTFAQYETYARGMGGILPSGSTVRHRLGNWTEAIRAAAAFRAGIDL